MKTIYLVLLGLTFSLLSCSQASHRENGWYHIMNGQKDSISKEPIVLVKDFETLKLDSDSFGRVMIIGTIKKEKAGRWADATEKAIGKRIGFIYNDKVITDPQVNMRIESGNFMISNPYGDNLREIYQQLLKEMSGTSKKH